jgi:hypothetical protein
MIGFAGILLKIISSFDITNHCFVRKSRAGSVQYGADNELRPHLRPGMGRGLGSDGPGNLP